MLKQFPFFTVKLVSETRSDKAPASLTFPVTPKSHRNESRAVDPCHLDR